MDNSANNTVNEVYSLMIPIIDQSILLPNATVAEIVPFGDVNLEESGPDWYIGTLRWHGQDIPMVSIDKLQGADDAMANKRARVAVVNTLNSNEQLPYIGIIVQGIPRLTHVTEPSISLVEDVELGSVEKARVKIGSIQALVPDLDKLESLIEEFRAA
ncbi:chemotaxis protein CheW [Pleionea mediterranea]|uniref:Chemosensory pili system protein ChpC n=1 Tax=Pleionea mediterranea TaxID=523701 RepID=A0A316FDC4_9GAMM|nr:chemotaxis protein CheW [Pleionea mediterranea]PWK46881.1 chemosensory pili system protein ChpC [Pleionea mediterranea]